MSEHRCVPGRRTIDRKCTMHPEHHWCSWCEGFYGVPHDYGCHTKDPSRASRPDQCACRYCTTLVAKGWQAAEALHRERKEARR